MNLSEGGISESQHGSSYNKREFDDQQYNEYEEKILSLDSENNSLV
jgi:hypothetical protein